ncbi:MAG: hypothetical protein ACI8ZM_000429 [Crocinitomix sp.]|jgi:hypothetical protein
MKRVIIIAALFFAGATQAQLSNTIAPTGPVGIGTASPVGTNQLTVNGSSLFQSQVELTDRIIVNGQTILKNVVRMTDLANYTGLSEDMEILVTTGDGNVTKTTLSGLVEAFMEPFGLDYCGGGDVARPRWFSGLNKLFSPCDVVNVGIGTDSPDHKLDVKGTTFSIKLLAGNSSGSSDAIINGYSFNHSQKLIRLGKKIGGLTEEVRFEVDNNGAVSITNVGNSASITINNGVGNAILVNSNSGNKILQVEDNGLIRARRIKVDSEDWADYVFEKGYNRLTLTETEQFIKKNGHLPNIPSASEIKEDGLDLAEMQKLQMEKIEELTLYMIEMDQKMTALQNENNQLKNEVEALKK